MTLISSLSTTKPLVAMFSLITIIPFYKNNYLCSIVQNINYIFAESCSTSLKKRNKIYISYVITYPLHPDAFIFLSKIKFLHSFCNIELYSFIILKLFFAGIHIFRILIIDVYYTEKFKQQLLSNSTNPCSTIHNSSILKLMLIVK